MFRNTLEQQHLPYMPVKGNNSGAGILLVDTKKKVVLLGKRTDGEKPWCTPGGKIKNGETPVQGVKRETFEESGLKINNPSFLGVDFGAFSDGGRPWVTYTFYADVDSETYTKHLKPQATEISVWEWVDMEQVLSRKLFPATQLLFDKFAKGSTTGVIMDSMILG